MGDENDERCACGHARCVHGGGAHICHALDDEHGAPCCRCQRFRRASSVRGRAIAVMGAAQLCALNAEGLEVHEAGYVEGLHREMRSLRADALRAEKSEESLRESVLSALGIPAQRDDETLAYIVSLAGSAWRAWDTMRRRLLDTLHLPVDATDDAIAGAVDSAVRGERVRRTTWRHLP